MKKIIFILALFFNFKFKSSSLKGFLKFKKNFKENYTNSIVNLLVNFLNEKKIKLKPKDIKNNLGKNLNEQLVEFYEKNNNFSLLINEILERVYNKNSKKEIKNSLYKIIFNEFSKTNLKLSDEEIKSLTSENDFKFLFIEKIFDLIPKKIFLINSTNLIKYLNFKKKEEIENYLNKINFFSDEQIKNMTTNDFIYNDIFIEKIFKNNQDKIYLIDKYELINFLNYLGLEFIKTIDIDLFSDNQIDNLTDTLSFHKYFFIKKILKNKKNKIKFLNSNALTMYFKNFLVKK